MDRFFKLIQDFLESRKNASEPQLDFEFEEVDNLGNMMVTIHTEDDYSFTMSIFDEDQWMMVTDISKLSEQSVEDVVRSLDASSPNVIQFTRDDLNPY